MERRLIFKLHIPHLPVAQLSLRVWSIVTLIVTLVAFPAAELVGQLTMNKPSAGGPPPLSEARKISGVLHFTRGARDWREAELRLEAGGMLALRCRHFLASDACFNLQQGEKYEGKKAVVWWHPDADVLQLQVEDETVVRYADTAERFAAPPDDRVLKVLVAYFAFLGILLVIAMPFVRASISK
jgi:hypothetical protein